jgi:hypothetical protein
VNLSIFRLLDEVPLLGPDMKVKILKIEDSNMAGDEWVWEFYAEKVENGLTVSCRHWIDGSDPELPQDFDPVTGLRNGTDLYETIWGLLERAGCYELGDFDQDDIAENIAKIDPAAAEAFLQCPELLEQRIEAEEAKKAAEREMILRPYREIIDQYISRFDDKPLRYPGGASYGTPRSWAKRFIEEYVIEDGHLPTGKHDIEVRGYSGPAHDFGDFK